MDRPTPVTAKQKSSLRRLWREVEFQILITAGLISLLLGAVGFFKHALHAGDAQSMATSLYSSLGLFKLGGGAVSSPIPWELEVARWLSPSVAMYAVLLGLAALFRNQACLIKLKFSSGHVVICGLGSKGLNLAKNFKRDGFRVVVVEKDGNHPNITQCRELGTVCIIGDARDEDVLCKAGLKRARYLISVCGGDSVNADVALTARKIVQNRPGAKLSCSIHICDPRLWVYLRAQEFSAVQSPNFRLDFFNIFDQGAKQLFREFPLVSEEKNSVPHILLVGFGKFAEQLIINAARQWSPKFDSTDIKLRISVVDPQAELFIKKICHEYSLVEKICEWRTYPFDTASAEYLDAGYLYDDAHHLQIATVFVTYEDESIGLSSAIALLDKVRSTDVQVLVRMNEEKGLASLIRETDIRDGTFDNLHMFGLLERTCQPDLVYNSSHEAIARAVHREYLMMTTEREDMTITPAAAQPWEKLPETLKEMNREQTDGIGAKLKAINCDIVPWTDYGGDKFAFSPQEIETMAEMEHQRWCEQKMRDGWKYNQVRSDNRKEHPSLVPWGDERLSETEKDKDRNTVKQIPYFLALAGYQVYQYRS